MTLRELAWRVDARLRQRWTEVSCLAAAVYNAQPGRKSVVKPHRLNPYRGLFPQPEPEQDLASFAVCFGFDAKQLQEAD